MTFAGVPDGPGNATAESGTIARRAMNDTAGEAARPGQGSPTSTAPQPDPASVMEYAARIALGMAGIVVGAVARAAAEALRREAPSSPETALDDGPRPRPLVPLLAGASARLALDTASLGVRAASSLGRSGLAALSFLTSPAVVRRPLERARSTAMDLDERWRLEREHDEDLAAELFAWLAPSMIEVVLDRIDLTDVVLSHLDLDRITDAIDVEGIAERINIGRLTERLNVDALVARVDVEAVVRRVDAPALAREVIDEIDLTGIIRESTGTIADETVEGIRAYGMTADRALSRYVDHILRRNGRRDEPDPSR